MSGYFREGRRYPIAYEKRKAVEELLGEPINMRLGARFEGGFRWTVWTESLKIVSVEVVGDQFDVRLGERDPSPPRPLR